MIKFLKNLFSKSKPSAVHVDGDQDSWRKDYDQKLETNQIISFWKKVIIGQDKSIVLFSNGSAVFVIPPQEDPRESAKQIMAEHGRVIVGSPLGDFGVKNLNEMNSFIVTCHHNDIQTFVHYSEVESSDKSDLEGGLLGRYKRGRDAEELEVIYYETL